MKAKSYNKISTFVLTFLMLILFGAVIGTAAPGDLDLSFGSGGIFIIRDGGNNGLNLQDANGMAIQADGKIVVVGRGGGFAVVRYNTDGSLDTSFDGDGIVSTQVGGDLSEAFSVAIQADGKIVVVGSGFGGFGVVRLNPNGSLDTTFNGTGIVITPVNTDGVAWAVAIQPDGKIVAAGQSGGSGYDFALVRYNTNGSPDTSFDGDGIVTTDFGSYDITQEVVIQADGKIVAVGYSAIYPNNNFAVVRYNTDGSLDTSFNGTGKVITPGGYAFTAAIQADGKIIAAGENNLVRYNTNGTLDTSFNGSGIISIPIYANSVAIQTDDKIVVAGSNFGGFASDFAAVRLNPNGSLDTTFNFDGVVITPAYVGNYYSPTDYGNALAIQEDGKIVVAGNAEEWLYDFYDFAVVRYHGGSNANIRTRFDFDGDGKADVSVFRPSDRVWYLNRSTQGFYATQFGLSTDKITPADFDGDGKTDIAVFRDGLWYWINSSNGTVGIIQFGLSEDIPVPADFTGDGRAELAVYRGGVWWSLNLSNNQTNTVQFGNSTDKPVVADYDGDGRTDQAVYRNGEWHLNRSTQGYTVIQFGISTDKTVQADYDGDGRADQAVYRDGTWYLLQSSNGFTAFQFGISSDIPTPADYDGDGKADAAVYRNGIWWILQSTNGTVRTVPFGLENDKPIPAAFVP